MKANRERNAYIAASIGILTDEEIAMDLGISIPAVASVRRRYERQAMEALQPTGRGKPVVNIPPKPGRSVADLIKDLEAESIAKRAFHEGKRRIEVKVYEHLPYGILVMGDPHLGDPGCDIALFNEHCRITRERAYIYGVNMGDFTNNWVGSLARLYSHQSSTDGDERKLIEYMLTSVEWLWVILGNHDQWSPVAEMLCKAHNIPYVAHGGKFYISSQVGEQVVIDARHTHRGHSQFNPSHAQLKRSYRGSDAHVILGAHTHTSAETFVRNPETGLCARAIRVAGYKSADEYADSSHFDAESVGPACLLVIDHEKCDDYKVLSFWDIEAGIEYLDTIRLRRASGATKKKDKD